MEKWNIDSFDEDFSYYLLSKIKYFKISCNIKQLEGTKCSILSFVEKPLKFRSHYELSKEVRMINHVY